MLIIIIIIIIVIIIPAAFTISIIQWFKADTEKRNIFVFLPADSLL